MPKSGSCFRFLTASSHRDLFRTGNGNRRMSDQVDDAPFRCRTLAIVGVGLIGGAIAQHARRLHVATTIIGVGRNAARLDAARGAGIIDRGVTHPGQIGDCDLAVVCTPVDRIVADVQELVACRNPPVLITDAGSVKDSICGPLASVAQFVGSHPLAGSEKNGFEHSSGVQLAGRVCVVTPSSHPQPRVTSEIEQFWRALGMQVVTMPADRHDRILARTSHFPHLAAYALASLLEPGDAPFVAGGFRDTTRIAASDPLLWTSILLANRDSVLDTLDQHADAMARLRSALADRDASRLESILAEAQHVRTGLDPADKK
jgi:prephenate dehydrogenase